MASKIAKVSMDFVLCCIKMRKGILRIEGISSGDVFGSGN